MLSIGEFGARGGVSARVLRHYDRLGLLRPAKMGENGYRYYSAAQLPVLQKIERLKQHGFALKEIGALLPLAAPQLAQKIHERRLAAYGELATMRARVRRMEDDIIQMEGSVLALESYKIIVMEAPAQLVFALRRTINIAQTKALFDELLAEAKARGLNRVGATQQMYMGEAFDYDAMDIEAQLEVSGEAPGVKVLSAGLFVATTHTGPYETVHRAYEAIGGYLGAHPELKVCGGGIERYIKDAGMTDDPEQYETAVLFRVEKTG